MITDTLKKQSLELRKAKAPLASFSVFLLNEINKVGKNDGNRLTTENEAISVIKKTIEKAETTIRMIIESSASDELRIGYLTDEVNFMKTLLPAMASEIAIIEFLMLNFQIGSKKSEVMKSLKSNFGSLVDMKLASKVAEDIGIL